MLTISRLEKSAEITCFCERVFAIYQHVNMVFIRYFLFRKYTDQHHTVVKSYRWSSFIVTVWKNRWSPFKLSFKGRAFFAASTFIWKATQICFTSQRRDVEIISKYIKCVAIHAINYFVFGSDSVPLYPGASKALLTKILKKKNYYKMNN